MSFNSFSFNNPVKKSKKDKNRKKSKKKSKAKSTKLVSTPVEFDFDKFEADQKKLKEEKLKQEPIDLSNLPTNPKSCDEIKHFLSVQLNYLRNCAHKTEKEEAMKELEEELFVKYSTPKEILNEVFPDIIHELLRNINNPSESIRLISIRMCTSFLDSVEDLMSFISNFFPKLVDRVPNTFAYDPDLKIFIKDIDAHAERRRGRVVDKEDVYSHSVIETSEPARLLLCKCVKKLFEAVKRINVEALLTPYTNECIMFIQAFIRDTSPDVKVVVCELIHLLCEVMPAAAVVFAVPMIRLMKDFLNNRLARVRSALIAGIDDLMMIEEKAKRKGAGTEAIVDLAGFRESNVIPIASFYEPASDISINYFARLSQDGNAKVRQEFMEVLKKWITELPDRYDHQARLLPYILGGLSDTQPKIQAIAADTLEELGRQFAEDRHDDITEQLQYGVDGDPMLNHQLTPPEPYASKGMNRADLGTRLFIREHCNRFLLPLLEELSDWKQSDMIRVRSSDTLTILLWLMEDHITQKLHLIIPKIRQLLQNQEFGDKLIEKMKMIANILGRYVPPHAFINVLMPNIVDKVDTDEVNAGLILLAEMCESCKCERLLAHTKELLLKLSEISLAMSPLTRSCVLRILSALLSANSTDAAVATATFDRTGRLPDLGRIWEGMLRLTLEIGYYSSNSAEAQQVLEKLASACSCSSLKELFLRVGPLVLASNIPIIGSEDLFSLHRSALISVCRLSEYAPELFENYLGDMSVVFGEVLDEINATSGFPVTSQLPIMNLMGSYISSVVPFFLKNSVHSETGDITKSISILLNPAWNNHTYLQLSILKTIIPNIPDSIKPEKPSPVEYPHFIAVLEKELYNPLSNLLIALGQDLERLPKECVMALELMYRIWKYLGNSTLIDVATIRKGLQNLMPCLVHTNDEVCKSALDCIQKMMPLFISHQIPVEEIYNELIKERFTMMTIRSCFDHYVHFLRALALLNPSLMARIIDEVVKSTNFACEISDHCMNLIDHCEFIASLAK